MLFVSTQILGVQLLPESVPVTVPLYSWCVLTRDTSTDSVAVVSATFTCSWADPSVCDERTILIVHLYVIRAVFVGRDRVELVEAVLRPNIVTGTDIILSDDGDWPNLYWMLTSTCGSHAQAGRGWNETLGGSGQAAVACGEHERKDEQNTFHDHSHVMGEPGRDVGGQAELEGSIAHESNWNARSTGADGVSLRRIIRCVLWKSVRGTSISYHPLGRQC